LGAHVDEVNGDAAVEGEYSWAGEAEVLNGVDGWRCRSVWHGKSQNKLPLGNRIGWFGAKVVIFIVLLFG